MKLLDRIKHLNACELRINYPMCSFVRVLQFFLLVSMEYDEYEFVGKGN